MLYFQTEQSWLDVIANWASGVPEVDRVWVFGSRATGRRRTKEAASSVPDLDIGYTLQGSDSGSLLGLAIVEATDWAAALQRLIPVPIQLEYADPEDVIVWPAILDHGVLIYAAGDQIE